MTDEQTYLEHYDPRAFPPVAVTVDIALLTLHNGQLSALLIKRAEHPYLGAWALPGGFTRTEETLEEAARRELAEETAVQTFDGHIEQLASYGTPDRDPRMRVVSVAYLAITPETPRPNAGGDASQARLWPIADILEAEDAPALAFDHARIITDAVERTRSKLEYSSLATAFCEEPFTIADIRRVYESVWGRQLDPANFQRKLLATEGLIVPLDDFTTPTAGGGRPARLYRRGNATTLYPPLLRTHPA